MKKTKPEHNAIFMPTGYSGGIESPFESKESPEPAKETEKSEDETSEGETE